MQDPSPEEPHVAQPELSQLRLLLPGPQCLGAHRPRLPRLAVHPLHALHPPPEDLRQGALTGQSALGYVGRVRGSLSDHRSVIAQLVGTVRGSLSDHRSCEGQPL